MQARPCKRKCRPRYDPTLAERVVKRRAEVGKTKLKFDAAIQEVCDLAPTILTDPPTVNECKSQAVQIALVATLGLKTILLIEKAIKSVPSNTPNKCRVVMDMVATPATITGSQYLQYIQLIIEMLGPSKTTTSTNELPDSIHPTRILCPPVDSCVHDGSILAPNHKPTTVTVFTLTGPEVAQKYALKCCSCQCIYNYSMYGNKFKDGEHYYDMPRELIEVSDSIYCERTLYEFFCSLSLHSWVSFSGFSEAYFECCQGCDKQKAFITYWEKREGAGKYFSPLPDYLIRVDSIRMISDTSSSSKTPQLTRKMVSSMFYARELEKEIRDPCSVHRMQWRFRYNSDKEEYMKQVVHEQSERIYVHTPTPLCTEAGCGRCWAMDGNWKLCFPHCMYPVSSHLPNLPALHFPNVCPNQPKPNSAFCIQHHAKAEYLKYPTDIRGFLSYCGASKTASAVQQPDEVPGEILDGESEVVSAKLGSLASDAKRSNDVMVSQGTASFVERYPQVIDSCLPSSKDQTSCRKDLGDKGKLRLWSRGHIFIVRTCGHIDMWRPIYRSESPSQAFLIVISWLYEVLQNIPESQWEDVVLFYDNMCHLDSLKAASSDLPLPPPYNTMWSRINKVIDRLHIKNHVDERCRLKYNPEKAPQCNSIVAEQTFTWLSRYKRILCSMDKLHHLFFLHRITTRRNKYNELCLGRGRKPLLPKLKSITTIM